MRLGAQNETGRFTVATQFLVYRILCRTLGIWPVRYWESYTYRTTPLTVSVFKVFSGNLNRFLRTPRDCPGAPVVFGQGQSCENPVSTTPGVLIGARHELYGHPVSTSSIVFETGRFTILRTTRLTCVVMFTSFCVLPRTVGVSRGVKENNKDRRRSHNTLSPQRQSQIHKQTSCSPVKSNKFRRRSRSVDNFQSTSSRTSTSSAKGTRISKSSPTFQISPKTSSRVTRRAPTSRASLQ